MTGETTSDSVVLDKRPRSLVHMFLQRVEDAPDQDAYYYPVEGGWQESTWGQTHELVRDLGAGLLALGLQPGDRMALVVSTRYEWVLGYLAGLWAGAAVTSLDPATDDATIAQVVADSGARIVIAEDYDTVRMLWRIRADIRAVAKVVQVDGDYPDQRVLTLEGLLSLGHEHLAQHPRALSQRLYAVRRTGLAALSYAPDDGGEGLHGVGVTHAALTYRATALALLGQVGPQDRVYLDEPLGSTYGQAVLGLQLASGFALAIDGRPGQALLSLRTVRPSVVAATVRLLDQVRARAERDSGERRLDRRSAERAFDVARQVHDARAAGRAPTGRLSRRHRSLDRKVLAGVRAHFGDRLRFVVVAGGGLDADLADYFALVGVTVLEAYGTPESGPVSVALPDESGTRTAGRPLPGTEVAISDEGEIEVRGPGLAEGYDHDRGWWHTGDSGVLDDEGRLRVLGRLVRRR